MASGDPRPELLDEAEASARQVGEGAARAGALQAIGLRASRRGMTAGLRSWKRHATRRIRRRGHQDGARRC